MVKIKMFDGVVCTLGGVTCPKDANEFNILRLDSKGYKYSTAGRAIKITSGCLVLMKGKKCGDGLYHLIWNMVIDNVHK